MSTVVDLPDGNKAVLRDPAERTTRQKRPLQVLYSLIGRDRLAQIANARVEVPDSAGDEEKIAAEHQTETNITALGLSEQEWEWLYRTTDAALYSLLEDWSLTIPLPTTPDACADMPETIYEVLSQKAAEIEAEYAVTKGGFDLGGIESPDSPTGASADSTD